MINSGLEGCPVQGQAAALGTGWLAGRGLAWRGDPQGPYPIRVALTTLEGLQTRVLRHIQNKIFSKKC